MSTGARFVAEQVTPLAEIAQPNLIPAKYPE